MSDQAGDDAITAVRMHASDLAIYLGAWSGRDDTKAQPDIRQAANNAMDAIDAMVRELYGLRSRLVGEMRASDDATAVRVDALLRKVRGERAQ